jgi:hypothetical protein
MEQPSLIFAQDPRRFAFRATREVVNRLIPPHTIGAYLLLEDTAPIYVGRSDFCIRSRLDGHELLVVATHVVWEPCNTSKRAYLMESAWFHRLKGLRGFLNQIHPARPINANYDCPFCDLEDLKAITWALSERHMKMRTENTRGTAACGWTISAASTKNYHEEEL